MSAEQSRRRSPAKATKRKGRAKASDAPRRSSRDTRNGNTGTYATTDPSRTSATKRVNASTKRKRVQARHIAPAHSAQKRRGFPVWGVILILLVVAGLGVGGYFVVSNILHPYEGARVEDGQEVTVAIPEGSSGGEIIQILLDAGVIHSSSDFRKAAQDQQADMSLKPGTYTFLTGSDPAEIVAQLVKGPNSSEGQLQLPEGLTIKQTAQIVESSLGIPQDTFLAQAKASNYVNDYAFLEAAGNDSLEGYLYPKTYDLSGKEANADTVIRLMLDQYQQEVHGLDFTSAEQSLSDRYNLNVTDYDILKIASIIEKEAISDDDRPKVSSVFYNRLSIGQALESDATMGYETGGSVTADDLKVDSAYNTYLHKGLPPTPICSPSLWAIQAAMEPADTNYYFFFIIEDGVYSNHTFSEGYEEHAEAYKAALEEQRKANGGADENASAEQPVEGEGE